MIDTGYKSVYPSLRAASISCKARSLSRNKIPMRLAKAKSFHCSSWDSGSYTFSSEPGISGTDRAVPSKLKDGGLLIR